MNSGNEKKNKKKIVIGLAAICSIFFALNVVAKRKAEKGETADKGTETTSGTGAGIYQTALKPCMDKILSFLGLVLLSPVFLLLCIAVYIDDPGPVFFTQKRVGKEKEFFMLHKFRSMKMKTPHDVPTHQLENPEQYITRVGKFLRKYSLDELPQIWDIFRGKMSIIGPRPALWNQEDLVAERDRYGANDILPGLTGWAQINGRDELEISIKAKLDGEYISALHKNGFKAFTMDCKCFFGTIFSVLKHDGVVEGGTGAMKVSPIKRNDGKKLYAEDVDQVRENK